MKQQKQFDKQSEEHKRAFRLEVTELDHECVSVKSPIILSREQYDLILAETEYAESETRTIQIKSILSRLNMTEQERRKLQQTLVNSDLTVEFIQETYEPISKKNIMVGTKLPQRSTADKSKDYNFIR